VSFEANSVYFQLTLVRKTHPTRFQKVLSCTEVFDERFSACLHRRFTGQVVHLGAVDSDLTTSQERVSQPKRALNRSALTLMIGTLASRATGFLRQSLLTQLFSDRITDAFLVAQRVPNLFRELLAEGALTNSFIPVYKSLPKHEAKKLSAALLGLLIAVNAVLLVVTFLATPWIVELLLTSNGNVDRQLVTTLVQIVFPFLTTISLSAWAMGILNAEEAFLAPAWAPVALNIVSLVLMLLFPDNAVMLGVSLVVGGLVQFVVQLPALFRRRLLSFGGLWYPQLAGVLLLMIPSAFTTGGRQILNLIITNILDTLPAGSVTAFANADLFVGLVSGLFGVSPTLAYYSRLSDNAVNAPEKFKTTLLNGLRFIAFFILPAGLLLSVLARPMMETLFNWMTLLGRAGTKSTIIDYSVITLIPLGLAMLPMGLNTLLIRIFYIRKRITTVVLITVFYLALQALLSYSLVPTMGIAGLSWANVVGQWVQFGLLMVFVGRLERFNILSLASQLWRISLAAGFAGAATYMLGFLPWTTSWWSAFFHTSLGLIVFAAVYAVLSFMLKISEARELVKRLRG
jgi:putative peptidoglycan lipid II flippase